MNELQQPCVRRAQRKSRITDNDEHALENQTSSQGEKGKSQRGGGKLVIRKKKLFRRKVGGGRGVVCYLVVDCSLLEGYLYFFFNIYIFYCFVPRSKARDKFLALGSDLSLSCRPNLRGNYGTQMIRQVKTPFSFSGQPYDGFNILLRNYYF